MVGSINKVILVGNLGKDPDIRSMNSGKEVATFPLATSDTWKDRTTGSKRTKTEWHNVVIYNENLVSLVKSYCHKGSKLYIEGTLATRKWKDRDGHDRHTTEIVLQGLNCSLIILDSKEGSNGGRKGDKDEDYYMAEGEMSADISDDDIPF